MANAVLLRNVGIFALALFAIPLVLSAIIGFLRGHFDGLDVGIDLDYLSIIVETATSFSLFVAVGLLASERPFATGVLAFLLAEALGAALLMMIGGKHLMLGSLPSIIFHMAILPLGVLVGREIRKRRGQDTIVTE